MFIWKHAPYIVHHCHVHYYGISWNLFVTCALLIEISIWKFRVIHLWYKGIAIASARWNFLLFLRIEKSNEQMWRLTHVLQRNLPLTLELLSWLVFFLTRKMHKRMIIIVGAWSFVCILSCLFASKVVMMENCCVSSQMSIVLVMINC